MVDLSYAAFDIFLDLVLSLLAVTTKTVGSAAVDLSEPEASVAKGSRTHLVNPISLFLYAQRTDLLFCCMFIDEKIWCRYTMASLDRSPTTTKKLRFFSSSPLRMSAGIRESLARERS